MSCVHFSSKDSNPKWRCKVSDEKIETVSTTGQVHPGMCWGYYLRTATECGECMFADKCKDVTARVLAGKSIAGIQKPEIKTVEPKPAPVAEPPAPKPAKAPEKAPVAEAPKPAAPAPKAEAPAAKKAVEEPVDFDKAVASRIPGCTVNKSETETMTVIAFSGADGKGVLRVGIGKQSGDVKMMNRKAVQAVLTKGYTANELTEALDKLL
jgi:type IV secretory pathway VirB10-like protein